MATGSPGSPDSPRKKQVMTMIYPGRHKQLFLDDYAIESMSGVKRVLHQPEKHGPVLTADRSRGETTVQSRSVPHWNPDKGAWEWWYWAFHESSNGQHRNSETRLNHYAISSDGVNWESPSLGLYEWNGSKDNNVVWDPEGRTLYHIVRDERDEDPARRYKALFDTRERWLGVSPTACAATREACPVAVRVEPCEALRLLARGVSRQVSGGPSERQGAYLGAGHTAGGIACPYPHESLWVRTTGEHRNVGWPAQSWNSSGPSRSLNSLCA